MDVPVSPVVRQRRQKRRWFIGLAMCGLLALVTLGLARLEPAVPRVQRSALYVDTVQRSELVRQVRGSGHSFRSRFNLCSPKRQDEWSESLFNQAQP